MEPIVFTDPDTGDEDLFYVIEETKLAGSTYLLVSTEEEADSDAYILKQTAEDESGERTYVMVDNRQEQNAVAKVFSELLDDDTVIQ